MDSDYEGRKHPLSEAPKVLDDGDLPVFALAITFFWDRETGRLHFQEDWYEDEQNFGTWELIGALEKLKHEILSADSE